MAQNIRLTDKVSNVNEEDELRKRGYIVGVTLGEGSYAKVKSAFSETHNRKVALKIINRKKAPKDFQQRFLPRELHILRQIRHPNVIQLVDIMHFNHKVYIAMEMAGHGDLLEYIKLRGAIPEDKAKKMFQQLVNAIDYLHSLNIIHRDLKCENILLDAHNNLKISDFGFARIMNRDDISKTFCGSAAYAAPEILQGIPYTGHAYDIWSIGVILYIMVCGTMPYDDSNIKKMIKYQTERKVGFSRSKRVSESCKQLIHAMLEADISLRFKIGQVQSHSWLDDAKQAAADAAAALAQPQQQPSPDKQQPIPVQQLPPVSRPPTAAQPVPPSPQPIPVMADRPPLVPFNTAVANTAENNNNDLYERKRTMTPVYDARERRRKLSNTVHEPMDIQ